MPYVEVVDAGGRLVDGDILCTPCARERIAGRTGVPVEDVGSEALGQNSTLLLRVDYRYMVRDDRFLTEYVCDACVDTLARVEDDHWCSCESGSAAGECGNCDSYCNRCDGWGHDPEDCDDEDGDGSPDDDYQRERGCRCENCLAGEQYVTDLAQGVRS
jgi:hypothetical protein